MNSKSKFVHDIYSRTCIHTKMSSGKCRPFCLCLNVLEYRIVIHWKVYNDGINTELEVMAVTPQTGSQMSPQPRLWCHLGVCGVTFMTENELSMMILSWYYKFYFTLGDVAMPTANQLSMFKEQGHCKYWVTWTDCFATPSTSCGVKAGLVSLKYIDTLDKTMS